MQLPAKPIWTSHSGTAEEASISQLTWSSLRKKQAIVNDLSLEDAYQAIRLANQASTHIAVQALDSAWQLIR